MNAYDTKVRNFTAATVGTYTNQVLLSVYGEGERVDADLVLAEINKRGGYETVRMTAYAPLPLPHGAECVALDGEDCCGAYAYGK